MDPVCWLAQMRARGYTIFTKPQRKIQEELDAGNKAKDIIVSEKAYNRFQIHQYCKQIWYRHIDFLKRDDNV